MRQFTVYIKEDGEALLKDGHSWRAFALDQYDDLAMSVNRLLANMSLYNRNDPAPAAEKIELPEETKSIEWYDCHWFRSKVPTVQQKELLEMRNCFIQKFYKHLIKRRTYER